METYEILIKGQIDPRRAHWFGDLTLTWLPTGETRLAGALDQPALHAVLTRIRDLGLPLLLVRQEGAER